VRRARPLLGTFVEIAAAGAAARAMHAAVEAAFGAVAAVHRLMSFHDQESDVCRLNAEACSRPVKVHPWTFQVIKSALDLHRRSAGAFDIAVAPVLQDMGLLPRHCDRSCSGKPATAQAIELIPPRGVRFTDSSVKIDLGGIAKGFAVDRAIEVLQAHGMAHGLVNAGGDLAAFGAPEVIYLRDPCDPRRLMCCVDLRDGALASSGSCFDPLRASNMIGPAIIDPSIGKRPRTVVGATVRAPCCLLADALTKVAMIAGPSAAAVLEHHRAGALIVLRDGGVRMTRDFEGAVCLAA
jgi:thiamine biosynthesis lipoprotein